MNMKLLKPGILAVSILIAGAASAQLITTRTAVQTDVQTTVPVVAEINVQPEVKGQVQTKGSANVNTTGARATTTKETKPVAKVGTATGTKTPAAVVPKETKPAAKAPATPEIKGKVTRN